MRFFLILTALFAAILHIPASAQKGDQEQAQQNDVVNASRSVVRVALIGNSARGQFLLGHGSGVMVADGYVVTNAHVVAPLREQGGITIQIVPSEGNESFQGQLVTANSRADLALITTRRGAVRPVPIFTGSPSPTARVAAIGYPGNVDMAENLTVDERVRPLSAVRTFGQLSGGRSRRDVDTLLHTAAMARGNSGGPLVDECGRIIGINSFGALAQENDAEFGFAISARELIPFLREANIQPEITTDACIPLADRERQAQSDAERQSRIAERQVTEAREMRLALSVAMIVVGALVLGGGVIAMIFRNRWKRGRIVGWIGIFAGLALMVTSVFVFLTRPELDSASEETAAGLPTSDQSQAS